MPSQFKKVTENFWVSPQMLEEHIQAAADAGFRTLINNRPDGEEPGQPSAEALRQAASHRTANKLSALLARERSEKISG